MGYMERPDRMSERALSWNDKRLERLTRKLAGTVLKPEDKLLDIDVGNLRRLRENGSDKAVALKQWANAIPATRGLMTITYTRQRAVFTFSEGSGGIHCPLIRIHRAQLLDNRNELFAFTQAHDTLSIMEFEPASRVRDAERAKLPAERREHLERIDLLVQTSSLSDLWTRPPGPIRMKSDEGAALPAGGQGPSAKIDEDVWDRLTAVIRAAHELDREALRWPASPGGPGQEGIRAPPADETDWPRRPARAGSSSAWRPVRRSRRRARQDETSPEQLVARTRRKAPQPGDAPMNTFAACAVAAGQDRLK